MGTRRSRPLFRLGIAIALASAAAACTKGGQFDPTTLLDNDMFDNKKPVVGQREPVFPQGVPGVTSGIPQDLYKGYQPPPDQATADTSPGAAVTPTPGQVADTRAAPTPITPGAQAKVEEKPKPKPKPKPKVARAPEPPRTSINIGLAKRQQPAAPQEQQPAQQVQTDWPAPPPTTSAQPSQSVWPAPPSTAAAQPAQSVWPDPPRTSQ
jgi:hypothetical protein